MIDISVIIITLNEERDLPRCLRSIPPGCELIILDSMSSDKTEEIARSFGAQFYSRPFTNFSEQKNAALSYASRSWVLALDADEVLSPLLQAELLRLAANKDEEKFAGYGLRRRLWFMGKRLRFGHSSDYPLRFFRRGLGHYILPIHERVEIAGRVGRLPYDLFHYSYRDLEDFLSKFNRYTSLAAAALAAKHNSPPLGFLIVFRALLSFWQRYLFRLGFLDGFAGFAHAFLGSCYIFIKYTKYRERALWRK